MSAAASKKKRERPSASQVPARHSGEGRNLATVFDGWRWVTLGDVVESMKNGIYKPSSFYAEDGLACLRMYNIEGGQIVWRDVKRVRLSEAEILDYELLPGDILVNRVNSRELVGKAAVVPVGLERCVFESKNIRIRVKRNLAVPEFINYRLLSAGSAYFNQNAQQVVGMASISQPQVARFPVPLPSLVEQRQIVAEIEKQFTRLDAGVAALRRVQANLKRYRAAVLKAACEGRLVPTEAELAKAEGRTYETGGQLLARILADRRKNWHGRGKYKEPAAPDTTNLPSLPAGWVWASIDALAKLENGDRSKNYPSRTAFVPEGIPFINAGHLVRGRVLLDEMNYISEARYGLLRAGKTLRGDILFCLRGSLGKVALVSVDRAAIASSLVIVRPCQGVSTSYLQCYLSSWWTQQMIAKYDNGSAQPNLAAGDLARFAVPLPPFTEQVRIVAEVDRRLSVIEELEAAVTASLQRATRLRQSILKRAFERVSRAVQ